MESNPVTACGLGAMSKPPLPHIFFRLVPKQGENDCAIAAMASYLRLDHGAVLAAAAQVSPTVWTAGLAATEMVRVGRKLGVKLHWTSTFDIEDDTGLLWVSYRDNTKEHVVLLVEGWVVDPDHNPVVLGRHDEWMAAHNGFPKQLLRVVE